MFFVGSVFVLLGFVLVFFSPLFVDYATIYQASGVIFFLIGILLIRKSNIKETSNLNKERLKSRAKIKKEGLKIQISFEDCKILSKSLTYEEPSTNVRYAQALNNILDSNNATVVKNIRKNRIKCNINEQGIKGVLISEPIDMDIKTMEIKLYMKKKTNIYFDSKTGNFFFDLDFLWN